jgi:hypothetical protein
MTSLLLDNLNDLNTKILEVAHDSRKRLEDFFRQYISGRECIKRRLINDDGDPRSFVMPCNARILKMSSRAQFFLQVVHCGAYD